MNKLKRPEQKLISFFDHEQEMTRIQKEIDNGWFIASIFSNGRNFIGIMEKKKSDMEEGSIYIPPKKKIKFSA